MGSERGREGRRGGWEVRGGGRWRDKKREREGREGDRRGEKKREHTHTVK